MIKIKDLVQKYGEYSIDEEKLKKLLVRPKSKTVWDLEKGDTYFSTEGQVVETTWRDCRVDYETRDIGNCFLTREEAEFEVERRKCETIMLKYGTRDIESLLQVINCAYYIFYDNFADKVKIGCTCCINNDYTYCINTGCIYFSSEEFAQKAIDEIGEDRIKKYIFNTNL